MTDSIISGMADKLRETLDAGFTDEALTKIKKAISDLTTGIEEDIEWRLKEDMSGHLSIHVADMAKHVIEAILNGNEDEMRRYLSCQQYGWSGRDRDHPVIHGELFEQGAIAIRKGIVDAHADLLKNERILDLEDQVRSLVEQVNKANRDREAMYERYRSVA